MGVVYNAMRYPYIYIYVVDMKLDDLGMHWWFWNSRTYLRELYGLKWRHAHQVFDYMSKWMSWLTMNNRDVSRNALVCHIKYLWVLSNWEHFKSLYSDSIYMCVCASLLSINHCEYNNHICIGDDLNEQQCLDMDCLTHINVN